MKSILIEEDLHRILVNLSKQNRKNIKGFVRSAILYFKQTGQDPDDLSQSGLSKNISGIKRQLDFLVRMQKTNEKTYFRPISESVLGIENSLENLTKTVSKSVTDFDKTSVNFLSKVSCPKCRSNWQIEEPGEEEEISCEGCGYVLPIKLGNVSFTALDIVNILSEGMSRIFNRVEIGAIKADGIRFYLDHDLKIKTQKFRL